MSLYYFGSFYFSDKIDALFVSVIQMSFLMNTTVLFTIIWNYINVDVYIHADYLQYLGIFRVSFNYVSIKYLCALHSEFSKCFSCIDTQLNVISIYMFLISKIILMILFESYII